jgi:transcriptional regulator with XRE-family HTH domain
MYSHLGQYIRSRREAAQLRIVEVARRAGLGEKAKILRQIENLEKTGQAEAELLQKAAAALQLDAQEIEEAHLRDAEQYQH